MIRLAKMSSAEYYTNSVGGGRENYYLDAVTEGEPPGQWSGELASKVGLVGEVDPNDMHRLFSEFQASDGTPIGSAPRQFADLETRVARRLAKEPTATPERVAEIRQEEERRTVASNLGWDATFSVPKDVSLAHAAFHRKELAATRQGDIAEAERFRAARLLIETAVDTGNAAGLDHLSAGLVARAGSRGDMYWLPSTGAIVATFAQSDNREGEPHMHRHNTILNRVDCADGKVRAIDGQVLIDARAEGSAVADRAMVDYLARHGLVLELTEDGISRRWAGIDTALLADEHSTRRKAVTGRLAEMVAEQEEAFGRPLSRPEIRKLEEVAFKTTRRAKSHDGTTKAEQLDLWAARSEAVGGSLDALGEGLIAQLEGHAEARAAGTGAAAPTFSPLAICEAAVEAVAVERPTWTRGQLMVEIEKRLPAGVSASSEQGRELLASLTDKALADVAVQVAGRVEQLPPSIDDGKIRRRPGAERFAAPGTLAAEEALRRAAKLASGYAAPARAVAAWLDANAPSIGADQRAAVIGLASTDAAVSMLSAPAGSGKSYATARLADAWSAVSGGGRVHGLALSSVARDVLAADGIPVTANLERWQQAQARIAAGRAFSSDLPYVVASNDLIVVDEASMADTAALTAVWQTVNAAGARMVLTGDARQLAAVTAGGALPLLEGHADTYHLAEVRRFAEDWEAEATLRLREHDAAVLREYDARGRIREADTAEAAGELAARAAAADILSGRTTIVVTSTNTDAAKLAAAVRGHLVAAGHLPDAPLEQLVPLAEGGQAGVGDLIQARANDNTLGLVNRHQYKVLSVGEGGQMRVALDGRHDIEITLPGTYARQHVALAYAGTVHATQGRTLDTCHLMVGDQSAMDAQALYVALSRGRDCNTAWVGVGTEASADAGPGIGDATERPSAVDVLGSILEREGTSDSAAVVVDEHDLAEASSAASVIEHLETGVRLACAQRLDRQLDELTAEGVLTQDSRDRIAGEAGRERLSTLLRAAELTGHDPAAVLEQAVRSGGIGGGLETAEQASAALAARIDRYAKVTAPETQAPPAAWTCPGGVDVDTQAWFDQQIGRVEGRAQVLGSQAAEAEPSWALTELGPVPADEADRSVWEQRAGVIAAYREASRHDDDRRAIDHIPGMTRTEQRAMWWQAWQAAGRPETSTAEAVMSDGQLRERVAAWERAKALAPAYVAEALRSTETRLADETAEAVLAEHLGDLEDAEQHLAAARLAVDARPAVVDAHDVRAAWYAEHRTMERIAEAAASELESRGIDPGHERDETTAAEWLAAERAARGEDDQHREVDQLTNDREDAAAADQHAAVAGKLDHVDQIEAYAVELDAEHDGLLLGQQLPAQPTQAQLDGLDATTNYAANRLADQASQDMDGDLHDAMTAAAEEVDDYRDHGRQDAKTLHDEDEPTFERGLPDV